MTEVDELFDVDGEGAVVLRVHVQPAAGRTAVAGRHGNALKVRVGAAPERGRANDACAALLADTFGIATAKVELAGGGSSRLKRFRLTGVDVEEFRRQLEREVTQGQAGPGPDSRPPGRR